MNTALNDTARMFMWRRLGYIDKAARQRLAKYNGCEIKDFYPHEDDFKQAEEYLKGYAVNYLRPEIATLDCCQAIPVQMPEIKKKESNMYMEMDTDNPELAKREYLSARLCNLETNKTDALLRKYGMRDDPRPTNGQEEVDRILAGKYVIEEVKVWNDQRISQIYWRDPAVKTDEKGYIAAQEKLKTAVTATSDAIAIKDPKDALTALQAFENTVFN